MKNHLITDDSFSDDEVDDEILDEGDDLIDEDEVLDDEVQGTNIVIFIS